MLGKYPVETAEHRCCQCGEKLDVAASRNLGTVDDSIEVARPFCSDTCEQQYRAQFGNEVEEFEDIYRAGAT